MFRRFVTLMMRNEGYSVLSASDGYEALELSRKHPGPIDLVITDLQMPRLDGAELCGHLIKERPEIKLLMMSGADTGEITSRNANLPFLPKPFDGQALKARVQALLAAPGRA